MNKILWLVIGLVAGVLAGKFVWGGYYGQRAQRAVRLSAEMELAKSGQEAFNAYKSNAVPIAIFLLERHDAQLEKALKMFPNDVPDSKIIVSLARLDLINALILTRGRLAKLSKGSGNTKEFERYCLRAKEYALRSSGHSTGIRWNGSEPIGDALLAFVEGRDSKNAFW